MGDLIYVWHPERELNSGEKVAHAAYVMGILGVSDVLLCVNEVRPGSDLVKNIVSGFNSHQIKTHALIGCQLSWAVDENFDTLLYEISSYRTRFVGVNLDIESPQSAGMTYGGFYMWLADQLPKVRGKGGLPVSLYQDIWPNRPHVDEHIDIDLWDKVCSLCDSVIVQSYGDSVATIIEKSKGGISPSRVERLEKLGIPYYIGVETNPKIGESIGRLPPEEVLKVLDDVGEEYLGGLMYRGLAIHDLEHVLPIVDAVVSSQGQTSLEKRLDKLENEVRSLKSSLSEVFNLIDQVVKILKER